MNETLRAKGAGEAVARVPGRFTFRSAGVLFVLSGVLELLSSSEAVALLGGLHTGVAAYAYHCAYAALFVALGFGFWDARRWTPFLMWGATVVYTVDRLQYVAAPGLMVEGLLDQLRDYPQLSSVIDANTVTTLLVQAVILFILSWWAFALYTHWRRAYFRR